MYWKKTCKECNEVLPIDNFCKNLSIHDGHDNICKICKKNKRPVYEKICLECGNKFTTKTKQTRFCSQKCSSDFRNKDKRIYRKCSYCEKDLVLPKSKEVWTDVYCNKECQDKHKKNKLKRYL